MHFIVHSKRYTSIFLYAAVVSSIVSLWCSSSHADLRAGAAKVDITPAMGVSLDGSISKNGPATSVHDRLHARCLVLDDGGTKIALVVCDACISGVPIVVKIDSG